MVILFIDGAGGLIGCIFIVAVVASQVGSCWFLEDSCFAQLNQLAVDMVCA